MYCSNCGTKLEDDAIVCPNCGAYIEGRNRTAEGETYQAAGAEYAGEETRNSFENTSDRTFGNTAESTSETNSANPYAQDSFIEREPSNEEPQRGKGVAIAALVLSILSVLSCCVPFLSIPLAIGGIVCGALGLKSRERTMALVGLIISILFLIVSVVLVVLSVSVLSSGALEGLDADFLRDFINEWK